MDNMQIALNWFDAQCNGNKVVMSDAALKPFSHQQRIKLIQKLVQQKLLPLKLGKHGLVVTRAGSHVGRLSDDDNTAIGIQRADGNLVVGRAIGWCVAPTGAIFMQQPPAIAEALKND